jgi:hypothetical protein
MFLRDKSIVSSVRTLHKKYDRKGSVGGGEKNATTTTPLVTSLRRLGAETS